MRRKEKNRRIKKRLLLFAAVALVLILGSILVKKATMPSGAPAINLSCQNCSVIFLNMELLRADYVNLITGSNTSTTPNIDKFFQNSMIFTEVMAPAGYTLPSNIAVLTGQDGFVIKQRTDLYTKMPGFSLSKSLRGMSSEDKFENFETIAQKLDKSGYYTINVNYGMLSGRTAFMDKGFDEYVEVHTWFEKNLSTHERTFAECFEAIAKVNVSEGPIFFLTRNAMLHSQPYKHPKNGSVAFFEDVLYKDTGSQYEIYFAKDRTGRIVLSNRENSDYSNIGWMNQTTYERHRELAVYFYDEQLKLMDRWLGDFFQLLERQGLINNTIIVLYSNHGSGLYDNRIAQHGTAYNSNVHVPVLIRHPKIDQQVRIDTPVSLIDLTPTIYEMLGVDTEAKTGWSELIMNGTYSREYLFGVNYADSYVRHGDMKLIRFTSRPSKLFNLTSDPGENEDLTRQYPALAKELEEILTRHEIEMIADAQKLDSEIAVLKDTITDQSQTDQSQ